MTVNWFMKVTPSLSASGFRRSGSQPKSRTDMEHCGFCLTIDVLQSVVYAHSGSTLELGGRRTHERQQTIPATTPPKTGQALYRRGGPLS